MKVKSIDVTDNSINIYFNHDGKMSCVSQKFIPSGDNIKFISLTDYVAHSGNVAANIQFKLNMTYGRWYRLKRVTKCYKMILYADKQIVEVYIDGVLSNTHDISWLFEKGSV